mmetsp:Transcript_10399/g.27022  ORF Transcript_10399/g.27022 Transcript_10399/m.27022 type:complete len:355 (-) Transcript_10399:142-1206(-)
MRLSSSSHSALLSAARCVRTRAAISSSSSETASEKSVCSGSSPGKLARSRESATARRSSCPSRSMARSAESRTAWCQPRVRSTKRISSATCSGSTAFASSMSASSAELVASARARGAPAASAAMAAPAGDCCWPSASRRLAPISRPSSTPPKRTSCSRECSVSPRLIRSRTLRSSRPTALFQPELSRSPSSRPSPVETSQLRTGLSLALPPPLSSASARLRKGVIGPRANGAKSSSAPSDSLNGSSSARSGSSCVAARGGIGCSRARSARSSVCASSSARCVGQLSRSKRTRARGTRTPASSRARRAPSSAAANCAQCHQRRGSESRDERGACASSARTSRAEPCSQTSGAARA